MSRKESKSSEDLDIEKRAIMNMAKAHKHIREVISALTATLDLRCFARHRVENAKDISALSDSLADVVVVRDRLSVVLRPYLAFHGFSQNEIEDWIRQEEESEEDCWTK